MTTTTTTKNPALDALHNAVNRAIADGAPVFVNQPATVPAKRKQSPKQAAFLFFLRNAGFSYDPKTETARAGRARCARELARAERDVRALGYTFGWSDDWEVGNHYGFYGEAYANGEPETCETCICRNADGEIVASLGCIDDADREYRRMIEAELALEALGR